MCIITTINNNYKGLFTKKINRQLYLYKNTCVSQLIINNNNN